MDKTYVTALGMPAPTGYAHAVKAGNVLAISGQLGLDADRRLVGPGDVAAQARQALDNIGRLLDAAGAAWSDVVKLTIYLTDIRSIGRVREVRTAYYDEVGMRPPATTTVGVTGLSVEGALIEIEAWAVMG
jgi:reactive intermediate/imine deaminase